MKRYTFNIATGNGSRIEARSIGNDFNEAFNRLLSTPQAKKFLDANGDMADYQLIGEEEMIPVPNDPNRYVIQHGTRPGWWVATDIKNQVVLQWQQGRYEQTKHVTPLKEHKEYGTLELATFLREIGEWIALYHQDKI